MDRFVLAVRPADWLAFYRSSITRRRGLRVATSRHNYANV